ncbi:MAG: protein kinase [bacterium]
MKDPRDGISGTLKVTDFGVARLMRAPARTSVIDAGRVVAHLSGAIVGTPECMAPEQLLGALPTVASDIYAAGVVLYECLSGVTPYRADTPMSDVDAFVHLPAFWLKMALVVLLIVNSRLAMRTIRSHRLHAMMNRALWLLTLLAGTALTAG